MIFTRLVAVGALMLSLSACTGSAYDKQEEKKEEPRVEVAKPGTSIHAEVPIGPGCAPYGDVTRWAEQPLSVTLSQPLFSRYRQTLEYAGYWEDIDTRWANSDIIIPSSDAYSQLDPFIFKVWKEQRPVAQKAVEDKVIPVAFTDETAMQAIHGTAHPDVRLKISKVGDEWVFNDEAKLVCGGIPVPDGRVLYIVDGVLLG